MSKTEPKSLPVVLIVDDSKMIRLSLTIMLKEEFELVEAADGVEAYDALCADARIQVVLTDAGMPNMDGYEFIEKTRAHPDERISQVPMIMVTGAEEESARERALDTGATDFILKPFDKAELLARMRANVRFDQTTRDLAETAEALTESATEDAVTGLHSKRYLIERGAQDLAFAKRHENDLIVISLAIDNYASYCSDTESDECKQMLSAVAAIMQHSVRKEDTVARVKEGQFAIMAPTAGRDEADHICQRIRKEVAMSEYAVDGGVTLSFGVVFLHELELTGFNDYLELAEQRMQQALDAGGNRLVSEAQNIVPPKPSISLDAAARVLQQGNDEKLKPFIQAILGRIVPLLEACDRVGQLGLQQQIETIRAKIES